MASKNALGVIVEWKGVANALKVVGITLDCNNIWTRDHFYLWIWRSRIDELVKLAEDYLNMSLYHLTGFEP